MSEFYLSDEFKKIADEWATRLKQSGFEDIEYKNGMIKTPDRRTLAFEDRAQILAFFIKLDHLMYYYPDMPRFERRVMQLYSQGLSGRDVQKVVKSSHKRVKAVIKRYERLIIAINRLMLGAQIP